MNDIIEVEVVNRNELSRDTKKRFRVEELNVSKFDLNQYDVDD